MKESKKWAWKWRTAYESVRSTGAFCHACLKRFHFYTSQEIIQIIHSINHCQCLTVPHMVFHLPLPHLHGTARKLVWTLSHPQTPHHRYVVFRDIWPKISKNKQNEHRWSVPITMHMTETQQCVKSWCTNSKSKIFMSKLLG